MQGRNRHELIRQRLPWEYRSNPTAEGIRRFFDKERREARGWRNVMAVLAVILGVSGELTLALAISVFFVVFAVAARRARIPDGAIDGYLRTATERRPTPPLDTTRA